MDITAGRCLPLVFLMILNYANAQTPVSDQTRYFELNTEILNEPCLDYAGKQYKGLFALQNKSGVYAIKVISAAELSAATNDCVRDVWALGFPGSFQKHVGMTVDEFAESYSNFMSKGSPSVPAPDGFFPTKPLSGLIDS